MDWDTGSASRQANPAAPEHPRALQQPHLPLQPPGEGHQPNPKLGIFGERLWPRCWRGELSVLPAKRSPVRRGSASGLGALPAAAPVTSAREDAAAGSTGEIKKRLQSLSSVTQALQKTLPTGLDGGFGGSSRPAALSPPRGIHRELLRTPGLPAPAPIYSFNCCEQEPSSSHNPPGKAQSCPERLRA